MLKRSGTLLLLALYLITGIGFAINLHYCGKLVTDVKIDAAFTSCKKAGMMPGMKCCRNRRIDIKIKDAHQGQAPSFLSKIFSFKLTAANYIPAFRLPQPWAFEPTYYHSPPGKLACVRPAFLKNRSFRI